MRSVRAGLRLHPIACQLAAPALLLPLVAGANPSGGQVTAGQALISSEGTTLTVAQGSETAIIHWDSFSIGAQERVVFQQPQSSSSVLNRVIGGSPSEILGQLSANGRVFLINPQGVLFGSEAQLDVGGLVASTLDIEDDGFLGGDMVLFRGGGESVSTVINQGRIQAADGGFVLLAGDEVRNSGLIEARLGRVALASGSAMSLSLDESGLVSFSVDEAALEGFNAGVTNAGDLFADGGQVLMTARVAQALLGGAVNNSGRIRAQSLTERDGEVILSAEGGDLRLETGSETSAGHLRLEGPSIEAYGGLSAISETGAVSIGIFSGGDIRLHGGLQAEGRIASFSQDESGSLAVGADVVINTSNGDILLGGTVTVDGRVESAQMSDFGRVLGVRLLVSSDFQSVTVQGPVSVMGSVGSVSGFDELVSAGALLSLSAAASDSGSGRLQIDENLSLTGQVELAAAGGFATVNGASLILDSYLGPVSAAGAITVSGTVDEASLSGFGNVSGALATVNADFSSVDLQGAVTVTGVVEDFAGQSGSNVSGASLNLSASGQAFQEESSSASSVFLQPGTVRTAGAILVDGRIGEFTAGDNSGAIGAVYAANANTSNLAEGGSLKVTGVIGSVTGLENLYVLGAFATSLAFDDAIDLDIPIEVEGRIGTVSAGDFAELSGAALWVDSTFGDVRTGGLVSVTGALESVDAGFGLRLSGAYAYLTSFFGRNTVGADLNVTGSAARVAAGGGAFINGAEVLLEGFGGAPEGEASLDVRGDITQTGELGVIELADPETGFVYRGDVLLDAGQASLSFRDITADDIFIYFDSDSHIGSSSLNARGYLEVFTQSFGPTLYGERLDIEAEDVFLSANTDIAALSSHGRSSQTVFFSDLGGGDLELSSGGNLYIQAANLIGGHIGLRADSIYSDENASIDAGALDAIAERTLFLRGPVHVGTGLAESPGDAELLRRLGLAAPELLPGAGGPNAFLSAPTVGLAALEMEGDYLHIRSDFVFLGELAFGSTPTLVHLDPMRDLPLFSEGVDASVLGTAADKVPQNRGRVQPNIGSFDSVLGERPTLSAETVRSSGQLSFEVGAEIPSLGELILGSGLADQTLVLGGSDYQASIQVSDRFAVDVLPSTTNFVFLTTAGILGADRIATNGRIVILGGTPFSLAQDFYDNLENEITTYYASLASGEPGVSPDDNEEEDREEQVCR